MPTTHFTEYHLTVRLTKANAASLETLKTQILELSRKVDTKANAALLETLETQVLELSRKVEQVLAQDKKPLKDEAPVQKLEQMAFEEAVRKQVDQILALKLEEHEQKMKTWFKEAVQEEVNKEDAQHRHNMSRHAAMHIIRTTLTLWSGNKLWQCLVQWHRKALQCKQEIKDASTLRQLETLQEEVQQVKKLLADAENADAVADAENADVVAEPAKPEKMTRSRMKERAVKAVTKLMQNNHICQENSEEVFDAFFEEYTPSKASECQELLQEAIKEHKLEHETRRQAAKLLLEQYCHKKYA